MDYYDITTIDGVNIPIEMSPDSASDALERDDDCESKLPLILTSRSRTLTLTLALTSNPDPNLTLNTSLNYLHHRGEREREIFSALAALFFDRYSSTVSPSK